jgi:hypothetical protein
VSVRLLRNVRGRAAALRLRSYSRWGFGTSVRLRLLRRPRGYGRALARLARMARTPRALRGDVAPMFAESAA